MTLNLFGTPPQTQSRLRLKILLQPAAEIECVLAKLKLSGHLQLVGLEVACISARGKECEGLVLLWKASSDPDPAEIEISMVTGHR